MRQTWDEQRDNQDDYLRHIQRGEAYTPHSHADKWRRRCYAALALALLALTLAAVELVLLASRVVSNSR